MKHDRYDRMYEDRRNILPKSFDKWAQQQFGGIEEMASDYDSNYNEMYPWIENEIDEDNYDNYQEYEEELDKAQLEQYRAEQENRYDDWLYKYRSFKFPMIVYRVIDFKAKNLDDIANAEIEKQFKKGIGIYWTDGDGELEAYWSKGGKSFTIRANIQEKDVDWGGMLLANMSPLLGDLESEITLEEGTRIMLTGIAEGKTVNSRDFEEIKVMVRA